MSEKDSNKTIFYCNEAYQEKDLKVENTCEFCGCKVTVCWPNLNSLPAWAKLDIKFGEYIRQYCLCERCGKEVIEAIDSVKQVK